MKVKIIWWQDNNLFVEYENEEVWCYENVSMPKFELIQDILPSEDIISILPLLLEYK